MSEYLKISVNDSFSMMYSFPTPCFGGSIFAFRKNKLYAFDAKATYLQYKRFLEQAANWMRYSDYVFLFTTPGLAVKIGEQKMEGGAYGENELKKDLKRNGIGLVIVDLGKRGLVRQVLDPEQSPHVDKELKEARLGDLGWGRVLSSQPN
jgi:hypothetical protein